MIYNLHDLHIFIYKFMHFIFLQLNFFNSYITLEVLNKAIHINPVSQLCLVLAVARIIRRLRFNGLLLSSGNDQKMIPERVV